MRRLAHLIALLTAALACAKGNGSGPPALAPGAPTGVMIERLGFGNYLVRWTSPVGSIDGYEVQDRINGGPFEAPNGPPVDPRATQLQLFASTPDEIHELDLIEVRLRALKGGLASGWSDLVGVREPPLSGGIQATTSIVLGPAGLMSAPPIVVTIETRSALATELKLERAEVLRGNAIGTWVRLPPTDPSVTTYSDADVIDGTAYEYRVAFGAQGVWSEAAELPTTPTIDVYGPAGLTASIIASSEGHPAGVHLAWSNRSATADEIGISALPLGLASTMIIDSGTVSATLGAMDDLAAWPFWPLQSYFVVAQRTGYIANPGFSDVAQVPAYVLSGPLTLEARVASVPQADQYLVDGAGGIHASVSGNPPRLFRPQGTGWEAHDLPSVTLMLPPGLSLDSLDHPHVIYREIPAPGAAAGPLRHEWHDGTQWTSEDVQIDAAATPLAFAADPAGKAHVVYTTAMGDAVHLSNESGTWMATTLPDVPAVTNPLRSVHVAPDGTLYVSLIGSGTPLGLLTRGADGTWSAEQVPGVDVAQMAWFLPAIRGHAAFAFERITKGPTNVELWYVAQGDAGWTAPELIARGAIESGVVAGSVALDADGSRSFLVAGFPDASGRMACELFERNGTWSSMMIGPDCGAANVAPKVGADGKLRMVVGLGILGSASGVPVFTEQ